MNGRRTITSPLFGFILRSMLLFPLTRFLFSPLLLYVLPGYPCLPASVRWRGKCTFIVKARGVPCIQI